MQNGEKLCLQWNDFKDNVSSSFGQLRGDNELSDVTLACEDGQQLEAHKVILASSSPFFMQLLRKNKHVHPLIFMRGLKFEDLTAIVDFIYLGEANVSQESLDNFLALAEELELKGLTGRNGFDENNENIVTPQTAKENVTPNENPKFERGRSLQEPETTPSARSKEIVAVTNFKVNVDLEELDYKINSMIDITDKVDKRGFRIVNCNVCGNEGPKAHVMRHIEANHITGVSHSCELCGKTSRSRHALRVHKSNNHAN